MILKFNAMSGRDSLITSEEDDFLLVKIADNYTKKEDDTQHACKYAQHAQVRLS